MEQNISKLGLAAATESPAALLKPDIEDGEDTRASPMFFKALAKFKALGKKPLQEQHDSQAAHFPTHRFHHDTSAHASEQTQSIHATSNASRTTKQPRTLHAQQQADGGENVNENEDQDASAVDRTADGAPSETQWGVLSSRPKAKAKDPNRRSVAGGDAGWGGSSRRQSLTRAGRHKSVHYSNLGDAALHLRANPRKRPSIAQALSQRQKMLLSEGSREAGMGALSVSE